MVDFEQGAERLRQAGLHCRVRPGPAGLELIGGVKAGNDGGIPYFEDTFLIVQDGDAISARVPEGNVGRERRCTAMDEAVEFILEQKGRA